MKKCYIGYQSACLHQHLENCRASHRCKYNNPPPEPDAEFIGGDLHNEVDSNPVHIKEVRE